jgi:hypothetical protein
MERLLTAERESSLRRMDAFDHTVETLNAEIRRIVAERQELRAAGASETDLEHNRRLLARAQTQLSQLLIQRHLGTAALT